MLRARQDVDALEDVDREGQLVVHDVHGRVGRVGGHRARLQGTVAPLRAEVAPRANDDDPAPLLLVAHDLPGVVPEHPGGVLGVVPEHVPDLLDVGVVGEVHRPDPPVGLLEEAQARVGDGEVELVVLYVRGTVGVLHDVRVAQPNLAVVAGPHAVEADVAAIARTRAEAVLKRSEHVLAAQIQGSTGGVAGLEEYVPLDDRAPAAEIARAAYERDDPVLVGHEGEPERRLEEPLFELLRAARLVIHPVDPGLDPNGLGVLVVIRVDVVELVPVETGVDGALGLRRDVHDHGREGRPLTGVGPEDGVVVVLPGKTHPAVPRPDEAIILVGGTGTQDRVVAGRVPVEAVVEPDEVFRQQVERPKLLPRLEREVRGIQVGRYRPGRRLQHARPGRGAYSSRAGQLQEVSPGKEPLVPYAIHPVIHIPCAPLF